MLLVTRSSLALTPSSFVSIRCICRPALYQHTPPEHLGALAGLLQPIKPASANIVLCCGRVIHGLVSSWSRSRRWKTSVKRAT